MRRPKDPLRTQEGLRKVKRFVFWCPVCYWQHFWSEKVEARMETAEASGLKVATAVAATGNRKGEECFPRVPLPREEFLRRKDAAAFLDRLRRNLLSAHRQVIEMLVEMGEIEAHE